MNAHEMLLTGSRRAEQEGNLLLALQYRDAIDSLASLEADRARIDAMEDALASASRTTDVVEIGTQGHQSFGSLGVVFGFNVTIGSATAEAPTLRAAIDDAIEAALENEGDDHGIQALSS